MGEVTECVNGREPREWQRVYGELRVLGARVLRDERSSVGGDGGGSGRDLTGVVHEAWLKLSASPPQGGWDSRAHFFGAASRAMRQALVDRARKRSALKREGGAREVPLDESAVAETGAAADGLRRAVEVDAALRRLERVEPRWAAVAEMKLFGNLPPTMIAERLGVTARTVERDWERASAWLRERMGE